MQSPDSVQGHTDNWGPDLMGVTLGTVWWKTELQWAGSAGLGIQNREGACEEKLEKIKNPGRSRRNRVEQDGEG